MIDQVQLRRRGLVSTGFHIPYNPRLIERARMLRRNMTIAEKRLWFGLFRNFPYTVLRQKPLDNYIVDFYCPKLKLVIEVDGESHCAEVGKQYDEVRTQILGGYGLAVVRVANNDVMEKFSEICRKIRGKIRDRLSLRAENESPQSPHRQEFERPCHEL